jgi:excisionase family DNA binding protein
MAIAIAPETISIKEAAARLSVHENTVRNWIDRGLLDGYRTPTGRRKLRLDDVQRVQREMYGVPVAPRELDASTPPPAQAGNLERSQSRLP